MAREYQKTYSAWGCGRTPNEVIRDARSQLGLAASYVAIDFRPQEQPECCAQDDDLFTARVTFARTDLSDRIK